MVYFMFIFLAGIVMMFGGYSNYLIILLGFELMFYGCLTWFLCLGGMLIDYMSFLILLIMIVCGSCYGLCLLIMIIRSVGCDLTFNF